SPAVMRFLGRLSNSNRGSKPASWQKMRKGVSDLHRRSEVSKAANGRYLDSLASVKTGVNLQETVGSCCKRKTIDGKKYRALNLFSGEDLETLEFLAKGENAINGFRNKDLRNHLYEDQDCPKLKKSVCFELRMPANLHEWPGVFHLRTSEVTTQ
ncbi:MAG: hypothetical protein PHO37_12750, partial [Kiritimatiellae bacterium]|nr:hypothetical protein [Kiritimatiellia bacterium]